jgi:hypothetical protein
MAALLPGMLARLVATRPTRARWLRAWWIQPCGKRVLDGT